MKRKNWVVAITAVIFFSGAIAGNAMAVDEIRIGTIGPITGWATIFGQGCLNGIKLALDEYNNEFNGVPIKVFSEDTKADVEVMRTKLDTLKTRDNVHLIKEAIAGRWAARLATGRTVPVALAPCRDLTR